MLNIKFNEKDYEIRNQLNELTIGEFEKLSEIMNDKEKNSLEKWSLIFAFLGLPVDVIDSFDTFTFIDIIKEFNIFNLSSVEFAEKLTLKGIDYCLKTTDNGLHITVKEMKIIENFVIKDNSKYLANMLAVLYKRPDVDANITYDNAHIKFKADLIRDEITADVAIPFITFLSQKLLNDYELLSSVS